MTEGGRADDAAGAGDIPDSVDDGGNGADALERRMELVDEADRVEEKLRRTRLTPWVWMMATIWFLIAGFYTGTWPPAGFMAVISALLAASSFGIRRARRRTLGALREEMEVVSGRRGSPPEQD